MQIAKIKFSGVDEHFIIITKIRNLYWGFGTSTFYYGKLKDPKNFFAPFIFGGEISSQRKEDLEFLPNNYLHMYLLKAPVKLKEYIDIVKKHKNEIIEMIHKFVEVSSFTIKE